jgi:hypothetical protein
MRWIIKKPVGTSRPRASEHTKTQPTRVGLPVYSTPICCGVCCVLLIQLRRRRRETPNPSKPVPSKSRVAGSGTDAGLPVSNIAPLFAVAWKDGAAAEPSLKNPTMSRVPTCPGWGSLI